MRSRRLFTRGDDSVIGLSGFAQHFFPPSPLYWTANTFPVLLLYIYQYLLNQRSGNKKKSGQKRREQHDVIFLSEALLSAVPACVCVVSAPFSLSSAGHFWMTGPSFFSIQKYNVLGSNGILYLTGLSNRCDCFFSPPTQAETGPLSIQTSIQILADRVGERCTTWIHVYKHSWAAPKRKWSVGIITYIFDALVNG